jgi:TolB-like protein
VVTFVVWAALAGFPLALIFAWFYNLPPEGASVAQPLPDGSPSPSEMGPSGRRRLVATSAAAGTAVFLTSAWFVLQRRDRVSPMDFPEAAAAGIAVLPFEVRGHPDYQCLGTGMVDLMTTRIEGTGNATPVPARAVMGLVDQEEGPLTLEARRRVAISLGAGRYIAVAVVKAGGQLSVPASLIEPATGDEVATTTVQGTEAELFTMVDDLAQGLVASLAGTSGARLTQTAALTTDSLSAL